MVRVSWYDPGRRRDMFAMLGADITDTNILILNAKEWGKKNFLDAENEIGEINKLHPFKYHFCETNNQGWHVIDNLRRIQKIPVIGINTGKDITDLEKIRRGQTMDKPRIIEWTDWARTTGVIKMPKKPWTSGIVRLNRQLDRFVVKFSGGKVKYEAAEEEDHDDLVMCLLGICHVAKTKFLRLQGMRRASLYGAGIGDSWEPQQPVSRDEKAMEFAKAYLEKKGTPYDKIDVRFG